MFMARESNNILALTSLFWRSPQVPAKGRFLGSGSTAQSTPFLSSSETYTTEPQTQVFSTDLFVDPMLVDSIRKHLGKRAWPSCSQALIVDLKDKCSRIRELDNCKALLSFVPCVLIQLPRTDLTNIV